MYTRRGIHGRGPKHNCTWHPRGRDGRYFATYVAAVLARNRVRKSMRMTNDRYDCKVAAKAAIPHRESKAGKVLRSYRCLYCGGYHLTKMPPEEYLRAA